MLDMNRKVLIRSRFFALIFLVPLYTFAQSRAAHIDDLHREIDKLSDMVTKLEAERARSSDIQSQVNSATADFSVRDSLRLVRLKRKQSESRARIDQLTLDIIKLSKQLEDPRKRYALAKKLKQEKLQPASATPKSISGSTEAPEIIDARSIDLLAVKLVREGKSLDQARLLTIESLSDEQVRTFYYNLGKEDRYELYDIADEIVRSENVKLVNARRSAIYFYLFAK